MVLGKDNLVQLVLVFGLVFSTATQLRIPGLPVGLGEMLLLCWLALTAKITANRKTQEFKVLMVLAVVATSLLAAGYSAQYPHGHERPAALHDALAYGFSVLLAMNFSRLQHVGIERIPVFFLSAFLVSVGLALLLGWAARSWTGVDVFYGGERWQHLSVNPNQFALLALMLPYLSIYVISSQTGKRWFAFWVGVLGVLLGLYSRSDALCVAWLAGGLIAIVGLLRMYDVKGRQMIAILLVLMTMGSAWQLVGKVRLHETVQVQAQGRPQRALGLGVQVRLHETVQVQAQAQAQAQAQGFFSMLRSYLPCQPELVVGEHYQANVRFCLWRHALDAIEQKPLIGWGPGPHSGISKPFSGDEAHNLFLDWAMQSGLIGLLLLALYLIWVSIKVLLCGRYELLAALVALFGFSMFHHTLRQPMFWLIPLIALKLSQRNPATCGTEKANREALN